jgi:uncharacterized protein
MEMLKDPWPWYVAGPIIALVMTLLLYFGRRFGLSSNFSTICTIAGAGRVADYFKTDWKKNVWNLVFVLGTIIGGYIGHYYLSEDPYVILNEGTVTHLQQLGVESAGTDYIPKELFSWHTMSSPMGWVLLVLGGFLVGFGTRYANGCTSGHAITGLSNLQPQSLIAVIGFFIGGLIMTWFLLPQILQNLI